MTDTSQAPRLTIKSEGPGEGRITLQVSEQVARRIGEMLHAGLGKDFSHVWQSDSAEGNGWTDDWFYYTASAFCSEHGAEAFVELGEDTCIGVAMTFTNQDDPCMLDGTALPRVPSDDNLLDAGRVLRKLLALAEV